MASDIEKAFQIRLASDIDISKKKANQCKTAVCYWLEEMQKALETEPTDKECICNRHMLQRTISCHLSKAIKSSGFHNSDSLLFLLDNEFCLALNLLPLNRSSTSQSASLFTC